MEKDIRKGKGYGFSVDGGKIFMVRCFECGKENWAPAVASGRCAWCGYDANNPNKLKKTAKKKEVIKSEGAVKMLLLEDKLKLNLRKRGK